MKHRLPPLHPLRDPLTPDWNGEGEPGLSPRGCGIVWIALLLLTGVTVQAARLDVSNGLVHVFIAMTVATLKAGLVVLWYMHIRYEGGALRLMVFMAFLFLGISISFTFFDTAYR